MGSLKFKDESMKITRTVGKDDLAIQFDTIMIDENGNELKCKFLGELKRLEIHYMDDTENED